MSEGASGLRLASMVDLALMSDLRKEGSDLIYIGSPVSSRNLQEKTAGIRVNLRATVKQIWAAYSRALPFSSYRGFRFDFFEKNRLRFFPVTVFPMGGIVSY